MGEHLRSKLAEGEVLREFERVPKRRPPGASAASAAGNEFRSENRVASIGLVYSGLRETPLQRNNKHVFLMLLQIYICIKCIMREMIQGRAPNKLTKKR